MQCQHPTEAQCNELLKLSQKYEEFFDGTLGNWKKYPLYFELKEDTDPIFLRPYPVPKVHKEMFKNEVEHLVLVGVLEMANASEWGAPPFPQSKHKNESSIFSK